MVVAADAAAVKRPMGIGVTSGRGGVAVGGADQIWLFDAEGLSAVGKEKAPADISACAL